MTKADSFLFCTVQLMFSGVSYLPWWLILERFTRACRGDENLTAKGAKSIQLPITTYALVLMMMRAYSAVLHKAILTNDWLRFLRRS